MIYLNKIITYIKKDDSFSHLSRESLLTSAGYRSLFEFSRPGWNVTQCSQGQLLADNKKEL